MVQGSLRAAGAGQGTVLVSPSVSRGFEADFFIFLSGSKCQTGLVLTWAAQRQKISVAMGQQCCTGEIVSFSVQSFCRKVSLPEMG